MRFALLIAALLSLAACAPATASQQAPGLTTSPVGAVLSAAAPSAPPSPSPAPTTPAPPAPVTTSSAPPSTQTGVFTMAIVGSSTVTSKIWVIHAPLISSTLIPGPVSFGDPLEVEVLDASGAPADNVYIQFQDPTTGAVLGLGTTTTGMGFYLGMGPGTGLAGVPWQPAQLGQHLVTCTALDYGVAPSRYPIVSCNSVTFVVICVP